ncbi:MAG: ribosome recycling factor [Patescibacteria group bacterium]
MTFQSSIFKDLATKAISHVSKDLSTLRTGRASVQMLDSIIVQAYGSGMKINELANISAPDANLLMIKPWDTSIIDLIEKAIATSGLNFNPVVDGDVIRIQVPPLTEERRKEMVKLLHQKIESGRVMLRSVRTDVKQDIEKQAGETNVSEDDIHNDIKELDKMTQEYMNQLDEMSKNKENELMTI